jgi:acetoin:2,6-dichlorophenolindophenol oxidoreductase subunit alpha
VSVTDEASSAQLSWVRLRAAYKVMRMIREFEDRVHEEYASGDIPGAVHLYAGQEAVAAGVCAHLGARDYVASTHRGHGHAIAKGCDVDAMMLEIYGKARGLCGGKGGSMHIADFEHGMLGANGVAAGGMPLACGAALSAKVRGDDHVAVAFVGDGGANQGVFHECLCLAAVWQLPVIFVVEDNGYAQATGSAYHLRNINVAERAAAFGIPASAVDGSDFFAVYDAAEEAVERARTGGGPSLLECKAIRFYGHMEGWDAQRYRAPEEVHDLRANRDPLKLFSASVTSRGLLETGDLTEIDRKVKIMIDAAVAVAKNAPAPSPAGLAEDVYASPPPRAASVG